MRTSEVIGRAIEVIRERGWTAGSWGISNPASAVCLEGALIVAEGMDQDPSYFHRKTGVPNYAALTVQVNKVCPAGRAVADYLGLADGVDLNEWNDTIVPFEVAFPDKGFVTLGRTRSKTEVIEMLETVQRIEAAKEAILDMAAVSEAEAVVAEVEPVTV